MGLKFNEIYTSAKEKLQKARSDFDAEASLEELTQDIKGVDDALAQVRENATTLSPEEKKQREVMQQEATELKNQVTEKFNLGISTLTDKVKDIDMPDITAGTTATTYVENKSRELSTSSELRAMRKEVKNERADFYGVEQDFAEAEMKNKVATTMANLEEEADIAQLDIEINSSHKTIDAFLSLAEEHTDMTLSELAKGTPEQQDAAELLQGLTSHMVGGTVNQQRIRLHPNRETQGYIKMKETKEAFRSDATTLEGIAVATLDPYEGRVHALMQGDTMLGKTLQKEYARIRKREIKGTLTQMDKWNTIAELGEEEKNKILEQGEKIRDKVKELARDPLRDGKKDGKDVRAVLLLGVGFLVGRRAVKKAKKLMTGKEEEKTSLWKRLLGGGLTLAGIYAFFKAKDAVAHKDNSKEEDAVDDASVHDSPEKTKKNFEMLPEKIKPEFSSVAEHTRDFAKKAGDVFQIKEVNKYIVYGLNGSFEKVGDMLDKSSVLQQHYFGDVYGFFNRVKDWNQLSKLFGPALMDMKNWVTFWKERRKSPEVTAQNFQERLLTYLEEAVYGENDFDNMLRQSMVVRMWLKNREKAVYRHEAEKELMISGFNDEKWPDDYDAQQDLIDIALEDETFYGKMKTRVTAKFLDKQLISYQHGSAFNYLDNNDLLAVKEVEIPKEIKAIDVEKRTDEQRMDKILTSAASGEIKSHDIQWMNKKAINIHESLEEEIADSLLELMREPYSVMLNGKDFNHDEFVKVMETPIKELQEVIGGFTSKEAFTAEDVGKFASHINDFHNLRKRIEYGTVMYEELSYDTDLERGSWTGGFVLRAFGKQYKTAYTFTVDGMAEDDWLKITSGYALTLPTTLPVHYGLKLIGGGGYFGKAISIVTFPARFVGKVGRWVPYKGIQYKFFPHRLYLGKDADTLMAFQTVYFNRFGGDLNKIAKVAKNANLYTDGKSGDLVQDAYTAVKMIINNESKLMRAGDKKGVDYIELIVEHFDSKGLRRQMFSKKMGGTWYNMRKHFNKSYYNIDANIDVLDAIIECKKVIKGLSGKELEIATKMMERNAIKASTAIGRFLKINNKLHITTKSGKIIHLTDLISNKQIAKFIIEAGDEVEEILSVLKKFAARTDMSEAKLLKEVRSTLLLYQAGNFTPGKGFSGGGAAAGAASGAGGGTKPGGAGGAADLTDDMDNIFRGSTDPAGKPTRGGGGNTAMQPRPQTGGAGVDVLPNNSMGTKIELTPQLQEKLANIGKLDNALEQAKRVSTNPSEIVAMQTFVQEGLDVPAEQVLTKRQSLMATSKSHFTVGLRVLGFLGIAFEGYTALNSFMSANEVEEFNHAKANVLRKKGLFEAASGVAGGALLVGELGGLMVGGIAIIPVFGQVALVAGAVVLIAGNVAKDLVFHTMDRYTTNYEELKKSHTKQLVYNHLISVGAGRSDTDKARYEPIKSMGLDLKGGRTTEDALEALVYLDELDNFPLAKYHKMLDTDTGEQIYNERFQDKYPSEAAFTEAVNNDFTNIMFAKEARFEHLVQDLGRYDHVTPASTMRVPDPHKMDGKGSITVDIPEKRESLIQLVPSDQYEGHPAFMEALKKKQGMAWLQQLIEGTASLSPLYTAAVEIPGVTEPLAPEILLDDEGLPTIDLIPWTAERLQQHEQIQKGKEPLDNALHEIATDVRGMHIPNTEEALRGAYASNYAAEHGLYIKGSGKLVINNEREIDKQFTRKGAHKEVFAAIQQELTESIKEGHLTNQGTGETSIMGEIGEKYQVIFKKYENIITQDKHEFVKKLYTFGQQSKITGKWFQPPLEYLAEGVMLGYKDIGEALYKYEDGEIYIRKPDTPVKKLSEIERELFDTYV